LYRVEHVTSRRIRQFAGLLLIPIAWLALRTTLDVIAEPSANHRPNTPVVREPLADQLIDPADVHMETAPFSDPDPGNLHRCSDWEIWILSPLERVWAAECIRGVERVHVHLGDGGFENSYAGRTELLHDAFYVMRVRHRDNSGDAATEWSAWRERPFTTGPVVEIFPLMLADILNSPAPQWLNLQGNNVLLPKGGSPAPFAQLGSPVGAVLLEIRRNQGEPLNVFVNKPPLNGHVPLAVLISAGNIAGDLVLPESQIKFKDNTGAVHTVYLPGIRLPSNQYQMFWVSRNGSAYYGDLSQQAPNFSQLARGAPVPWEVLQPGYEVEIVATGFQLPVNIAFVPNPGDQPKDPLYYVTELYGNIKVVTRDGTVLNYASGLLNFDPTGNFPGSGEQGLAGIAIEPASGDLFVGMLYDAAPPDGPHYPKVVRLHSADGGLSASTQTTVLDMPGEVQGTSHFISNISIRGGSKVFVHMGDGFEPRAARDLNSFRGKILRMNLDGSPAPGNPYYDASDGINARDYVYAFGVRNPFGGSWREADGRLYMVDNGPQIDRLAYVGAGRDYGWRGENRHMRWFAAYNWMQPVAPVNIAFVQPQTFNGSGFPSEKMDHAFVTQSGASWAAGPQARGKCITEFVFDAKGRRVSGPTTLVKYNGSGRASAAALAAGPDGLYFSDLYKDLNYSSPIDRGANILRIRFIGAVDFDAQPQMNNLSVQFFDRSTLPGMTTWTWRFGDGATSNERNPIHTYSKRGTYNVRLDVKAENGTYFATRKVSVVRTRAQASLPLINNNARATPGPEC
jgi:glucose/arabinose dehydrogenase